MPYLIMISVYPTANQAKKKKTICVPCWESESFKEVISMHLLTILWFDDSNSDGNSDNNSDSNDVGGRTSDGSGDVLSFTEPEDPFVSTCNKNVRSSPPFSMIAPSDSFARNLRDDEGEISDKEPMDSCALLVLI